MENTIIFMGTPAFATPALEALYQAGERIPLVITQPDRPKGRGKTVQPPPVKIRALQFGLPVIQPINLKTEEILMAIEELKPDFLVVVAFGQILPQTILDIPRYGAINIHPSLLPKYRGPAPIQHSIINGDPVTGVTTILLDEGMDSGEILLSESVPIQKSDTSESLHHLLAGKGAKLLIQSIEGLMNNTLTPVAQDHEKKTYAPRFKKEDGRINWLASAEKIDAFVRGMHPWPGAFTDIETKRHKIFSVQPLETDSDLPPGTVIESSRNKLFIKAGQGAVSILEIQGHSGKRLSVSEFLRGHFVAQGTILT